MDQSTFQWLAGIAIAAIFGLITWIARDMSEKIKEAKEDTDKLGGRIDRKFEATATSDQKTRETMDLKAEKLYDRINEQQKEIADLRETTAGFQGTFMTREEHARQCQKQPQPRG